METMTVIQTSGAAVETLSMDRTAVENLKVGDFLIWTMDTRNMQPLLGARWSSPREVVEIFGRGNRVTDGKAYVCFYTAFGPSSRISGTVTEGEGAYRLVVRTAEAGE